MNTTGKTVKHNTSRQISRLFSVTDCSSPCLAVSGSGAAAAGSARAPAASRAPSCTGWQCWPASARTHHARTPAASPGSSGRGTPASPDQTKRTDFTSEPEGLSKQNSMFSVRALRTRWPRKWAWMVAAAAARSLENSWSPAPLQALDAWKAAATASVAGRLGSTAVVVVPQGGDRAKTRFIPRRRSHRRRRGVGVGVSCRSTSALGPGLNRAAPPDGRVERKKLRSAPSVPPRGQSWRSRGFALRWRVPKHQRRRRRSVSMWCRCTRRRAGDASRRGPFSISNGAQGI